mmetsp:Transcript_58567/g.139639  ORF Transcript_58567/g.139639 Transcript_58567/m.139639 type:complete len:225 (-) Transcript_58567:241-915(-)|eukprot:CAMPEP_0178428730 /NCGR_PEP_ID=MMETSP0689_2-20121128/30432_1 /TAXON_ID=160604 /ORGANISM="Amphidinium massartii, Strain CS-259" /LENGTH=224 /DNA_ID=CAMNT_0020050519 /DNA_START=156 /DNA_END=830 /DNA_ORIENTATION=-
MPRGACQQAILAHHGHMIESPAVFQAVSLPRISTAFKDKASQAKELFDYLVSQMEPNLRKLINGHPDVVKQLQDQLNQEMQGRGLGAHNKHEMEEFKHELEDEIKEINKEVESNPELLRAVKSELGEDEPSEPTPMQAEEDADDSAAPEAPPAAAAAAGLEAAMGGRRQLGASPLLQDTAKQAGVGPLAMLAACATPRRSAERPGPAASGHRAVSVPGGVDDFF